VEDKVDAQYYRMAVLVAVALELMAQMVVQPQRLLEQRILVVVEVVALLHHIGVKLVDLVLSSYVINFSR
jgi:hypothetical protein